MHLPGARPFGSTDPLVDGLIVNGCGLLRGWAFQESTGSASANLNIFDGIDSGGILIAPITLAQGESTRDYPAGAGIEFRNGLYVNVPGGAIIGSFWVNPGEFNGDYVWVPGAIPIDVGP